MKKIIALALALVLALSMASVAFALVFPDDISISEGDCETVDGDIQLLPGETYELTLAKAKEVKYADYKLTYKITKGAALFDSIKLKKDSDDNAYIEIEVKENYTITDAKQVLGTITLTNKETKEDTYKLTIAGTKGWTQLYVANKTAEVQGTKKADDADPIDAENNTVYICEEDEAGYVKFNASALLGVTLKMASEEKAFMYNEENNGDIMDALEEKYPDAEIEAYSFGGAPSFKNIAEFSLQADYSDQYYIYSYAGGKLTDVDTKWNSEDGVYEWSTKTPRTYVISDEELVAADEDKGEEDGKNPDTGANDVVGVAAALAVVSLVAAGAVSLKK